MATIIHVGIIGSLGDMDDEMMVRDAVNAAMAIFSNFKDIPIPGHPDLHLLARAGLHAGEMAYGVVDHPIPKFVCFGSSISIATQLMLCSKGQTNQKTSC